MAGHVVTAAAGLLVLLALALPNQLGDLTPAAFLRLPAEALLAVALVLILPPRARPVAAATIGVVIGLLALGKVLDMGFFSVLARPFDPVLDWSLLQAGVGWLTESMGPGTARVAVVGAIALAVVALVLLAASSLRLARQAAAHRTLVIRVAAGLGAVWVVLAVLGAQIVPGVPVAAHHYDRAQQVVASLQDRQAFVAEAAVDDFRDVPGEQLLTALRGKDVVIAFVESYGRDAVQDPQFPQIQAALDAGDPALAEAGFTSRSAFLTAPIFGGASWLAHATLLSGLRVDNQQRYRTLISSNRLTLNGAFQRAGWRTVAVMPGIWEAWPEGRFFGYDEIYDAAELDYQGPRMNWGIIPDQYAMSAFERLERPSDPDAPVMATVALLSSHAPWVPLPTLIDWDEVGDGSGFEPVAPDPVTREDVDAMWTDPARVRAAYDDSVAYSLETLISYVQTYGDDDLVLILLGDHQPAQIVTGADATFDVPVSIITGDPAVLDAISGWGWHDGLTPRPDAPVWSMDAFRDHFLAAYSPDAPQR